MTFETPRLILRPWCEHDDEYELGYWIGKPFWGRSLIPEAALISARFANRVKNRTVGLVTGAVSKF